MPDCGLHIYNHNCCFLLKSTNVLLCLSMPKHRLQAILNMLTLKGAPVYSLKDKFCLTFSEAGSGVTSLKGI